MNIYRLISIATLLCLCVTGITGYTVSGNKILDSNGKPVMLRGINRPSFEWSATGQYVSLADYTLMKAWGANIIRLPTNQDFWLGSGGAAYKAQIQQQVTWINSLGMGVIIDLHWNQGNQQNMADRNSITYWSQVAAVYKNNPSVMFELYNEPHDVSNSQWLNGDGTYAGMQEMYNAIRLAGAQNVVIVGGLNWAYELSQVSNGYAVSGTNIAYATHPYDYDGKQAAQWPASFGNLAANYPVIMTEFGQYCATDNYVQDLLKYAQDKGIHFTAWAWFVSGCAFPSIISDWNGTPFPGVGDLVKAALAGNAPSTGSSSSGSSSSGSSTGVSTQAPSTPAPSGPVTPADGSLTVFSNTLGSGWQDWSWASPRSFASTAYLLSGFTSSIMFNTQAYGGIYLHTQFAFQLGAYNTVQFYVNGGASTVSASSLSVQVYGTGADPAVVGNAVAFTAAASSNKWTLISIPVSAFGVSLSTQITGVAIKSNVGDNAVVYVSNIAFVPSGNPTTTQAPVTQAPTTKPTSAPVTSAPTTKPTSAPVTSAPTTKPTTAPTSAPVTSAPTTKPTTAPTPKPSGGCDASSVKLNQVSTGSWSSNNQAVSQYNLEISHTCSGKTLAGLTLSATNWNPLSFWNINVASTANGQTVLTLPSYISSASMPFSIGYQNVGGQANFAVASVTFQ